MLIYFRRLAQFAFTCLGKLLFSAEKCIPRKRFHSLMTIQCISAQCYKHTWNAQTDEYHYLLPFIAVLSHLLDYMCVNWRYSLHLFNSIDWNNPESPPVRADLATNHRSGSEIINQPEARSIMWDFSVEEILTAP